MMTLSQETRDGCLVVSLQGSPGGHMLEQFEQQVDPEMRVVLDLVDATELDGQDLDHLVQIQTLCETSGGTLVLCRIPDNLRFVMSMLRLDGYFTVGKSVEESLDMVRAAAKEKLMTTAGIIALRRSEQNADTESARREIERVKTSIAFLAPTATWVDLLKYLQAQGDAVLDTPAVAMAIGADEAWVTDALRRLVGMRILTEREGLRFCPPAEVQETIADIVDMWLRPELREKLESWQGTEPPAPTAARPAPTAFAFFYVPSEEETFFTQIARDNGLIDAEQIARALELQEARAETGVLDPLDTLLVLRELINEPKRAKIKQAQRAHNRKAEQSAVASAAVQLKLVAQEQVKQLQELLGGSSDRTLLQVLIDKKFLSEQDGQRVAIAAEGKRLARGDQQFAEVASKLELVGEEQLAQAREAQPTLSEQAGRALSLDEVLVELGVLTRLQAQATLRAIRHNQLTGRDVVELFEQVLASDDQPAVELEKSDSMVQFEASGLKADD